MKGPLSTGILCDLAAAVGNTNPSFYINSVKCSLCANYTQTSVASPNYCVLKARIDMLTNKVAMHSLTA